MNPMLELKEQLKTWAREIRLARPLRKPHIYNESPRELQVLYNKLGNICSAYRYHHIAYSELRGRTRDQIERPAPGNGVNEFQIESIKAKYLEKINEALRDRAA